METQPPKLMLDSGWNLIRGSNVNIEVRHEDGLKGEVWRFYFIERGENSYLRFCYYAQIARRTLQHKWRTVGYWDAFTSSNAITSPPLPDDVKQEARKIMKAQIDKMEVKP